MIISFFYLFPDPKTVLFSIPSTPKIQPCLSSKVPRPTMMSGRNPNNQSTPSSSTKSLGTQSLNQKGSSSNVTYSDDTPKKQIIPDIAIGEYEPDMKQEETEEEEEEEEQQQRQREKIKEFGRLCPPVADRSDRDLKHVGNTW
jgi:hypothetical protein